MTAMKVVPVARLCINKFDGTVIARTWDECSKGLYPDRWDEGDDLYTLKEAKAALSAVEPAPDGLVEPVAWRRRHGDATWDLYSHKPRMPTVPDGWQIEPLYASPVAGEVKG